MARQSLEHSFLPGQSLWTDTKLNISHGAGVRRECARRREAFGGMRTVSRQTNAREQWKLESEFAKVREKILGWRMG
jgi:hypothetical protein